MGHWTVCRMWSIVCLSNSHTFVCGSHGERIWLGQNSISKELFVL